MIYGKYLTSMDDISPVLKIRGQVFESIKPDWALRDSTDDKAVYALAFSGDTPAACARLAIENDKFTISRVCVLPDSRKKGLGDLTIRMLLVRATDLGAEEIFVYPLAQAREFYAKYGFEPYGENVMRATRESIDRAGGCSGHCGKNA